MEQLVLVPGLSVDWNWLIMGWPAETSCNTLDLAILTHRHFLREPSGRAAQLHIRYTPRQLGACIPTPPSDLETSTSLQKAELWSLSCSPLSSMHSSLFSSVAIQLFNFSSASITALLEVDHDFLIVFCALSFHTPIRYEVLSSCTFSSHTIRGCTEKQSCLVAETFPVLEQ